MGCVETIDAIEKSLDNEAIPRRLVHQDIGNPVDVGFMHFGIATRETPMSGEQLSAHQS
jgi:hypothetical protein